MTAAAGGPVACSSARPRPGDLVYPAYRLFGCAADNWLLSERGVAILPKPFDLDALLEKVEAALARGRG